jgi:hypothetical protein
MDMTDEHIKIIEELKQNAVYNQISNEIPIPWKNCELKIFL